MKSIFAISLILPLVLCHEALALMKAGTLGNPSFEISVGYGKASDINWASDACQATLVKVDPVENVCTMVTAAHCVGDGAEQPNFIRTADFGLIKNFRIILKGNRVESTENDLALVEFTSGCNAFSESLKVPLGTVPDEGVDALGLPIQTYSASRAFQRLFTGFLPGNYKKGRKVVRVTLGGGEINGEDQAFATYAGDSGGGLFIKNKESDRMELIGVLSLGVYFAKRGQREIPDTEGSVESIYIIDLDWIKQQLKQSHDPQLISKTKKGHERMKQSFDALEAILIPQ